MDHNDFILDTQLLWLKADGTTRKNIFDYAIDIMDDEQLDIVHEYAARIV